MLSVLAEPRSWGECEKSFEDLVPELLIARAEMIPEDSYQEHSHTTLPLIIDLTGKAERGIHLLPSDPQYMPPDPDSLKRLLDQAVKNVYECKVRQLFWLIDRYVAGLQSKSEFASALKVVGECGVVDLNVESITSVVAARKHVTINSTAGRYMLREPIHRLASQLDPTAFVRIHRSVIINSRQLDHAKSMSEHLPQAVLLDGSRYPVGPNYRDAFANLMKLQ